MGVDLGGDTVDSSGDNVDVSSYKTDSNGAINSGERSGVGPRAAGAAGPSGDDHDVITTRQLGGPLRGRTLSRWRQRRRTQGREEGRRGGQLSALQALGLSCGLCPSTLMPNVRARGKSGRVLVLNLIFV